MTRFGGLVWRDGRFEDGWIDVEDGVVRAEGRGASPGPLAARGVVVPSPVNAHTHVADHILRGRVPADATLESLVQPPHGLKHRALAAASAADLLASMRAALAEAAAGGTRVLWDFREGGAAGARLLRAAAAGTGAAPVAFGRPVSGEGKEVEDVLRDADGLGISALRDLPAGVPESLAAAAREAGKPIALHLSEAEREDVDRALALRPHHLVHLTRATRADLARVADARVPVVVCPRSNARLLGVLPDVPAMLAAGVRVLLGTDNAMLQTARVLDEVAFARERWPSVPLDRLLAMTLDAPRGGGAGAREGDRADVAVFASREALLTGEPPVARASPAA